MAFKQKGKKGGGKKPNNNGYFSQNAQRFGKDFLKNKRSDEIKRDSTRIFKDIAFANGYTGSIGEYFLNVQFIKNLILAANESYVEYSATVKGLTSYYELQANQNTINPEEKIYEVLNLKTKQTQAYNIILIGLNNILNELDMMRMGKDKIAVYVETCKLLKSMSFNLKQYRYIL